VGGEFFKGGAHGASVFATDVDPAGLGFSGRFGKGHQRGQLRGRCCTNRGDSEQLPGCGPWVGQGRWRLRLF
jgi:hypothetical protein